MWIALIGLCPIVSSLADQRFLASSVRCSSCDGQYRQQSLLQTRVMVHLEAILTQFVFEHSLRIHLSVSLLDEKAQIETTGPKPMAVSSSETLTETDTETLDTGEDTVPVIEGADVEGESDIEDKSDRRRQKQNSTDVSATNHKPNNQDEKTENSLVGVMTNLVTTDLEVIKNPAGQLLILRQSNVPVLMMCDSH